MCVCVNLISGEGEGLLAAKQVIKQRDFIVRWRKEEDELRAPTVGKTEVKLWPLLVWREIPKKRLELGKELGQLTVMQGGCATADMASGSVSDYSDSTNMRLARRGGVSWG